MRSLEAQKGLTEGNLAQSIWRLAVPLVIQGALMDVFNLVDMIFVGRLGAAAIAAVSIGGVLMGLIRMFAMGISTGTVALVSRFVGEGRPEAARDAIGQSISLSVAFSAAVAVLGWLLPEPVLRLLGAAEDVIPQGVDYLRVMCVGSITMFLTLTLSAGMRGFGNAVTPMWALGLASLLNVGLDPLFIFGVGPFPRMGVAGSAIATVISRAVGAVILLWALGGRGNDGRRVRLRLAPHAEGGRYLAKIVRIGSFSALRMLSMNLSRLALVRIVALFGTFAVAAFGIGLRVRIFVMVLGFGLADATAVVVGQNLGAGKPGRAERSAWLSVGYLGMAFALVSAAFLLFPRAVIGLFNTEADVVDMGARFLRFFVPALLALTFAIVFSRAIEGAGDTLPVMVITAICLIAIGIPLAWWFSRLWGTDGIWAAMMAADVLQGLGTLVVFRLGRWKRKPL
jgi:putative MATE family efflux protein